ncbi:hypothetical protein [Paenibacillus odorifer]|uniref:hypothetical protein n=1 Tax=Paenibacillus odorifer TaxID=189426 RepID=UPI000BA1312D|nr:hypothetical protein [Paenibacillus odorifer]OZQ66553.1 hypothetical protein CA596_27415 [Paenibacillus odorifer]
MSSVVVLQTYDRLWVGSDSAVSARIGGVTYRWNEGGQKLWVLDDSVIFCSGRSELADRVMREFHSISDRSMEQLQEIAIRQHDAYLQERGESFEVGVELFLTILVCKYEQGRTVVYGLEPHNGFELIARILDNPTNFAIWSGGIKVNESATAAMTKFSQSMNVIETFQHTFDEISYEGIGGELTVYEIDRGTVKPFMHTRIKEKRGLKRLTERIVSEELKRLRAELVNAEVVSGQLGNFVSMVIGSGNDVTKINTNGISAGHDDYNSAPFRVNHQGNVVARSIKLTGEVSNSEVISTVIRASKIIGNEIEGGMITGALIRTSTGGQRVEMDTTGLRAVDAAGKIRVSIAHSGKYGVAGTEYSDGAGVFRGGVYGIDDGLYIESPSYMNLYAPIMAMNGTVRFQNATVEGIKMGAIDGLSSTLSSIRSDVNSKATAGISTGSAGPYNCGIPIGTVLKDASGTAYTWMGVPAHTHTQN